MFKPALSPARSVFPDYDFFIDADSIQSSLGEIDLIEAQKRQGTRFFKSFVLGELLQHQKRAEFDGKFFKDSPQDEFETYRFANIKSASATVVDTPNAFALRVNRLVVAGKQVGLAMSMPQRRLLANFYQFLLAESIPAVHILVQRQEYLSLLDMPEYHQQSQSIATDSGKLSVTCEQGGVYHQGKSTQTLVSYLTLTKAGKSHRVKVLHSTGWQDQSGLSVKQLNALLAIRNHAFAGMQPSQIITHCKAGVGRTGTLVCAEAMSKLGTPLVDTVVALRDSRNRWMVQGQKQLHALYRWTIRQNYLILANYSV